MGKIIANNFVEEKGEGRILVEIVGKDSRTDYDETSCSSYAKSRQDEATHKLTRDC